MTPIRLLRASFRLLQLLAALALSAESGIGATELQLLAQLYSPAKLGVR